MSQAVVATWMCAADAAQGWLFCEGTVCGRQTLDGRWCDAPALKRLPMRQRLVTYLTFAHPRAVTRVELGRVCGLPKNANLLILLAAELAAGVVLRRRIPPGAGEVSYLRGTALHTQVRPRTSRPRRSVPQRRLLPDLLREEKPKTKPPSPPPAKCDEKCGRLQEAKSA